MPITHQATASGTDDPQAEINAAEWNADHLWTAPVNEQSAAYSIVAGDNGKIVRLTGTVGRTFNAPLASTLPDDWFCLIENGGSIEDRALLTLSKSSGSSDTINGVADVYLYPKHLAILRKDGASAFEIITLNGGVAVFSGAGTYTFYIPPDCKEISPYLWGAGGGGGGGCKSNNTNPRGGEGGGGGAHINKVILAHRLLTEKGWATSSSVTITVGAGGPGGAGKDAATQGSGTAGTTGGSTTFSDVLEAPGGEGGEGGSTGGSSGSPGGNGAGLLVNGNASYGGQAGASTDAALPNTWGGAPGGGRQGTPAATAFAGADSVFGGPGGGAGGHGTSSTIYDGGPGGGPQSDALRGSGAAGGTSSTTPTNGADGGTATRFGPGKGGGGGGAADTGAGTTPGARGGHGGVAAGGGGGGITKVTTLGTGAGGDGGNGGDGLAVIYYS